MRLQTLSTPKANLMNHAKSLPLLLALTLISASHAFDLNEAWQAARAHSPDYTAQEQLAEAKYRYLAAYLQLLHLAGKLGKEEGKRLAQSLFMN